MQVFVLVEKDMVSCWQVLKIQNWSRVLQSKTIPASDSQADIGVQLSPSYVDDRRELMPLLCGLHLNVSKPKTY